MAHHGNYMLVHLCPCGGHHKPSCGDPWFSNNSYPCCPECGLSCYEREMVTGRMEAEPREKWWRPLRWKFVVRDESEDDG